MGIVSCVRHVIRGEQPIIDQMSIFNFYVVRPPIPTIVQTLERLGSIELAEEALLDDMRVCPDYRYFLYPKGHYKAAADTLASVREDI